MGVGSYFNSLGAGLRLERIRDSLGESQSHPYPLILASVEISLPGAFESVGRPFGLRDRWSALHYSFSQTEQR